VKQGSFFENDRPQSTSSGGAFAFVANIDGGARGNPGPAAYGVVIRNAKGEIVEELGEYIGIQTNNVAEYSGLLAALEYAERQKIGSLKILSDSELLVRQMRGQYKVKNPALRGLFERAERMVRKLQKFSIDHVMRESNKDADRLVNQVLDSRARGKH
jgi:ribonuclease HI